MIARDTALKLALAPVLVAQGLGVRRRTQVLAEAAGPREGVAGEGPELGLLIVGDSSAAGVGAETQAEALAGQLVALLAAEHRVRWRLVAHTGDTTADALERLKASPDGRFDLAVTALGVNDVIRGVPLARWLDAQAQLRALLAARFGVARILVSGLPPMGAFPALPRPLSTVMGMTARRYDRAMAAALAGTPSARHVPFTMALTPALMANDGFHPGPQGYSLWARSIVSALQT